jgi:hypothetical protein
LVLSALQDERVTRVIAHPTVTRIAMKAIAVQANLDRIESLVTTAVAHTFNLPTLEEKLALERRIKRLEAQLRALEAQRESAG